MSNIMMPQALEVRWQNYAKPNETLTGNATDAKFPNRLLPATTTDGKQLSAKAFDISKMPDVVELLQAVNEQQSPQPNSPEFKMSSDSVQSLATAATSL